MSTTDTRAAFEAYAKKHWDATCNKFENGDYKYGHTTMLWKAWQAATEAAKATGTAGEIDADAEMAKVKRDVELMGVGFLVDGKRCSLDRITWFNRPGDTWLPPPPGYPTEAARQPAPALPVKTWQERLKEGGWEDYTAMLAEIADLRAEIKRLSGAL